MISEFVREQKRYTRDNLKSIFCCSDADIIRIIKKLKGYGILKTVKNTDEQLIMSDLADEDIEVSDEDESSVKHLYVFTFVGIIIVEGRVLKCYPKYLFKTSNPTEELKQVIKVLQKYNSKEQIIRMYNDGGRTTTFNRLAVMVFLLNDYFENGIYTNTQDIIETNGAGEIHWDRTINNTYPIINRNRPYYVELQTKRRINDETDFFKRLHECILTACTKELRDADLIELLDIEGVDLTDEVLEDFGDDDYILYRLEKEMNVQFNTRKQMVLKTMEALIGNKGTLDDVDSFSMFGTNSFNLVWEKVCAEVMDNQLHTPINALGLEDVRIPDGAKYSDSDELISIIEKPKWQGYAEDESEFEKEANKTLTPDLISLYHHDNNCDFVIFDAKYYTVQLELTKELRGQPGVSDVTKQYLYQLAYKDFVKVNRFNSVRNCFLMPTEEEGTDGVIKKGSVKMDMLAALDLEQIQVRQLSAKRIFAYYLASTKVDIGKLDL
ncbi:LlaJI family restriction endonuclease [Clostridium felsineum]|uniref:LlaJI family restriction endonuclease n=1 Tax=Clostridium felsineum TaxID=36839 RepID=UPI00098CD17C|nr:LlaJI family restriction endonuclease [Clostridium felsineum]URZ02087.1 Type-2 restriction enzyme BsuMI component YdjA [Clostridium felsineum]